MENINGQKTTLVLNSSSEKKSNTCISTDRTADQKARDISSDSSTQPITAKMKFTINIY